jgi:hypothetical protein
MVPILTLFAHTRLTLFFYKAEIVLVLGLQGEFRGQCLPPGDVSVFAPIDLAWLQFFVRVSLLRTRRFLFPNPCSSSFGVFSKKLTKLFSLVRAVIGEARALARGGLRQIHGNSLRYNSILDCHRARKFNNR